MELNLNAVFSVSDTRNLMTFKKFAIYRFREDQDGVPVEPDSDNMDFTLDMLYRRCVMLRCLSNCVLCISNCVLCISNFVLCISNCVLCLSNCVLCISNCVLCYSNCVLCLSNCVLCPSNCVLCLSNCVLCLSNCVLCLCNCVLCLSNCVLCLSSSRPQTYSQYPLPHNCKTPTFNKHYCQSVR